MSCCPSGALGAAPENKSRVASGTTIIIEHGQNTELNISCYMTGTPLTENPDRIIVLYSDVFGPDPGLQKQHAETLAERLTCEGKHSVTVLSPDLFRGQPPVQYSPMLPEWAGFTLTLPMTIYRLKYKFKPDLIVDRDIAQILLPFIEKETGKKLEDLNLACCGFCYGGWLAARSLSLPGSSFRCGVGMHPSFKVEMFHGSTELECAKRIGTKPMLLMPTKQESAAYKCGGEIVRTLAEARNVAEDEVFLEFPTMDHGFVNRGDTSIPEIKENQEKALSACIEFILKYCPL